jgi:hypothetical protein
MNSSAIRVQVTEYSSQFRRQEIVIVFKAKSNGVFQYRISVPITKSITEQTRREYEMRNFCFVFNSTFRVPSDGMSYSDLTAGNYS